PLQSQAERVSVKSCERVSPSEDTIHEATAAKELHYFCSSTLLAILVITVIITTLACFGTFIFNKRLNSISHSKSALLFVILGCTASQFEDFGSEILECTGPVRSA